jgi:hypothetical protein
METERWRKTDKKAHRAEQMKQDKKDKKNLGGMKRQR